MERWALRDFLFRCDAGVNLLGSGTGAPAMQHRCTRHSKPEWNPGTPIAVGLQRCGNPCLASLLPFIAKTTGDRSLGGVGLIGMGVTPLHATTLVMLRGALAVVWLVHAAGYWRCWGEEPRNLAKVDPVDKLNSSFSNKQ